MARDADWIRDIFAPVVRVEIRRMFGGHGIYADGAMFGLEIGGTVYLKVDAETQGRFAEAGARPFVYAKQGREVETGFRELPPEAHEDPDQLRTWVDLARAAAGRAAARRAVRPRRRPSRPPGPR